MMGSSKGARLMALMAVALVVGAISGEAQVKAGTCTPLCDVEYQTILQVPVAVKVRLPNQNLSNCPVGQFCGTADGAAPAVNPIPSPATF